MNKIERLERKIERAKMQLAALEQRKSHLSQHGYWDMGYFQGQISVLEDWLDEEKERIENEFEPEKEV